MSKNVEGMWHDELGSEVTLEAGKDGALTGRFRPGGAAAEHDYPLCGYVRGELVAFVVRFDRHGTLASWVGHVVDDEEGIAITTLWHMALTPPHPERKEERWRGTWAGTNTFRRGAATGMKKGRVPLPLWSS